jgi:hypothetical protein
MNRRDFVVASVGASVSSAAGASVSSAAGAAVASAVSEPQGTAGAGARPQLLELRRYRFRFGPMEARFTEYAKGALVPALGRIGVGPVGAFSVLVGPDSPATYLLIPHPAADSVATLSARLRSDAEYQRTAAAIRSLPAGDPLYLRRESTLMVAFDGAPAVEVPAGRLAAPSRVFELRTYESHSESAGLKKIEMFEKAGEIAIFRRVGLAPVFFARNLIGPTLPSLSYMVVFPDLPARDKTWAAFREDPEWVKLRAAPGYTQAEIVSNTHSLLLRPTEYSQV